MNRIPRWLLCCFTVTFANCIGTSVVSAQATTGGQTANEFPDVSMAVPGESSIVDPQILIVISADRQTIAAYSSVTSSWDKVRLPRRLRETEKPIVTPKFASIMIDNEAIAISSKMCQWVRLKLPLGNRAFLASRATNMVMVSDRDRVYVLGENADRWKSFNFRTRVIE